MVLAAGQKIGAYEIVAQLGAGGMGEVYRARDSQLKREVAIKVLPADVAADPERLARFQREAEVLAALNHPNIAHVYGLAESALVMELVEGEDLSQRIARGAIPIDEALPIAKQIADALEAAHEQGIIHRDLKPANIKVRDDGTVKVLDFGLAKAFETGTGSREPGAGKDLANSPTITTPAMTMRGVILGTAAYMSPEQAKGKVVDQRADIWAFGCVLYEMLTGRRAFEGEDVSDTLADVLKSAIDCRALPSQTPPSIRAALRRCLEKDPRKRAPHIAVARAAIEDALATDDTSVTQTRNVRPRRSRPLMAAAIVAIAAIGIAAGYWLALRRTVPAPAMAYRSTLVIEENINPRAPSQRIAISPDGRWLAYVAAEGADLRLQLWVRSLDDLTARPLPGTEAAAGPFWSPDSRFIAFFVGGELKKIDITGGPPVIIGSGGASKTTIGAGPQAVQGMPGSWNEEGVIIFSIGGFLLRVPASGGTPEPLTTLADGETVHDFPHFLPDGRHFLYAAYKAGMPGGTYLGSLDGMAPVRVMEDSSNAQYANGFLLFIRGTALMAQRFDVGSGLTGEATPLVNSVLPNLTVRRGASFTVSRAGTLIYQAGQGYGGSRIVWATRQGVHTMIVDEPMVYRDLQLSPDGTRVSYTDIDDRGRSDLWVLNLARGARTRLSFNGTAQGAAWSPDGRMLVFNGGNTGALVRKAADGSGGEEPLPDDDGNKLPADWSRDGRTLLYEAFTQTTSNDLWALPLDGGKPIPIATTGFSERWPQFSPDDRFVAFTSDESGTREVYVTRFGGTARWQISAAGASYPRWSHDGRELYFYTPNGKINAVRITAAADSFESSSVTALFDARAPSGFARYFYDVAPDGRFLLTIPASSDTSSRLTLLVNWPALAK